MNESKKKNLTIMRVFKTCLLLLIPVLLTLSGTAQNPGAIRVETILDLNASGGVTADQDGNIYISDFGAGFGNVSDSCKVYKWNPVTKKLSVFAEGFKGASGATFDLDGNFYQSNNAGSTVSQVKADGRINYEWCKDTSKIKTPIGLEADKLGNIYVANCGKNEIGKISPEGHYETFAQSELFKCPNGLTRDDMGNLFTCNFKDGKVLKISPNGMVSVLAELPTITFGSRTIGNGHVVYSNGWLFVTTIGAGEVYRMGLDGSKLKIAGQHSAFENADGNAVTATLSKPNGIAVSKTGDTLYINVSKPGWKNNPRALHPGKVVMVTEINSLPKSNPGHTPWSKDEEEILKTINKFSQTTAPGGKGADAYANFLAEDFSRWTIGSDSIDTKKSWVEGVHTWFDDGWRVTDRRQDFISVDIDGDRAYTRRVVVETYTGPDGDQSNSSAALDEAWINNNNKWLLYRVAVKTLPNE